MTACRYPTRPTSIALVAAWVAITAALPALAARTEPADPARATAEAVERALELAAEDRCDAALLLLGRALEWTAEDHPALALKADCLRREQRLDEAWQEYRRLAELDPAAPHAWFWLGTIDRWRGRLGEAIEAYDAVLAIDDRHADALKGRARCSLALERPAEAEAALRRVLRERPDDSEAARLLAEARLEHGDLTGARTALRAALGGSDLELALGDLDAEAGRFGAAIDYYRRAALDPHSALEARRRLADAERRRGREPAALTALRQVVAKQPGDIGSLYWVGVLATRTGRAGEALAAWDSILAADPDNVGALIGKARILHYRGDRREALVLANRALDLSPDNGEALTLRATIFSATGRLAEAGADYESVLERDPRNVDARIGYRHYLDSSSIGIRAFSDSSRLVEGLDDEGALVNGVLIRPTRIEYLFEGVESFWRSHLGGRTGLEATLVRRREAVTNLDGGFEIYDFDVLEASAGLDHRFGRGWHASWRFGGTRYEPGQSGSIREDDRLSGRLALGWTGGRDQLVAEVTQGPFIYRGFAGDTQFEIFDRLSLGARWSRLLSGSWRVESSAAVVDHEQDDHQMFGNVAFYWHQGGRQAVVGLRRTPFPKRFLDANGRLEFLDSDALYARFRARLGRGFRIEVDSEQERIGAAPRIVDSGGVKIDGPEEHNTRLFGRLGARWSPRALRQLAIGAEHVTERFDFRSAVYNTLDSEATTAFVELGGGRGTRLHYSARYGHSLVSDDRDRDYRRDDVSLRLEGQIGPAPAPGARSLWLGIEGRLSRNTLQGASQSYDEERPYVRLYAKVPL